MKEFNKEQFQSLVKIQENKTLKIETINARDLWEYLESKQEYTNWIKNKIKKFGFTNGKDFCSFDKKIKREKGSSVKKEYHISIDMAKECAMTENTPLGKAVRQYYIELEQQLKTIREMDDRLTAKWQALRTESKWNRKDFTDIIKKLIEYAKDQGANNGVKWYYKHITSALNKSLFRIESLTKINKNLRDMMDYIQLCHVITMETILSNRIVDMISLGFDYKAIYENLKELCISQGKLIGKEKPAYVKIVDYKKCLNKKELKQLESDENQHKLF